MYDADSFTRCGTTAVITTVLLVDRGTRERWSRPGRAPWHLIVFAQPPLRCSFASDDEPHQDVSHASVGTPLNDAANSVTDCAAADQHTTSLNERLSMCPPGVIPLPENVAQAVFAPLARNGSTTKAFESLIVAYL